MDKKNIVDKLNYNDILPSPSNITEDFLTDPEFLKDSEGNITQLSQPSSELDLNKNDKRREKKLTFKHKVALLKLLALGYGVSEVQSYIRHHTGISISRINVYYYKDRYRARITEYRKEIFGEDLAHIAIAQKEIRLARYEQLYNRLIAKGRLLDAADILERARVEQEGKAPFIRTGDIVQGNKAVEANGNVPLTDTAKRKVDAILLDALEVENSRQPSALVA